MTRSERSPILPLIWLCFAVLLIPIALRVLYAVRLTQRQCQSGPLERAILQNDLPALRARLDHGASPNTRLELPSVASVSPAAVWKNILRGNSGAAIPLLELAALTEHRMQVQLLLERGANPNLRDNEGVTALMRAADDYQGSCETAPNAIPIMHLLIAHGAEVNAQNADGETALFVAVVDKKSATVRFLLEQGAAIHIKGGESALARAVETADSGSDPTVVRLLLEHGADPNEPESSGTMVIDFAVNSNCWNVVALLLDHGAAPNGSSTLDHRLLCKSIEAGRMDIFRRLLARGADVNAGDNQSPLTIAAQNDRLEMAKILLAHGAKPNASGETYESEPALVSAVRQGDAKLVSLFLAHGADPNRKDDRGDTSLIADADEDLWADYFKRHKFIEPDDIAGLRPTTHPVHLGIAQALIAHGADVNLCNNAGVSALRFARIGQKTALVSLLQAHGAQEQASPPR